MYKKPNIVLLTIDTLRADHLGCYGYHRPTSPNIDALSREGVLCEHFFCSAIPTQPSYTTLYTGQHPISHGIVAQGGSAQLSKEAPFLPQILLAEDYTTCALDNLLQERAWFARGYEYYIDPSVRRALMLGVTCEELNARAIPWLKAHADETFYLFLHYWDPHWPLTPPERYRDLFYKGNPTDPNNRSLDAWWQHPLGQIARDTWLRRPDGLITDAEFVAALYDQEIRYVDDGVGELVAAVDDLGLTERTLVIIVADHGESMTEHGIYFAHHGLYDCVLRVPFIARMPGVLPQGVRLSQMLQHQDIAPTLLEAVEMSIPTTMDGRSFWPLLTGECQQGGHEFIVSAECSWQAKWCLRTEDYKFILAREPDFYGNPPQELYHVPVDSVEEHNIVAEQSDVASAMEAKLEEWIAERLRALGKSEDPLRKEGISLGGLRTL